MRARSTVRLVAAAAATVLIGQGAGIAPASGTPTPSGGSTSSAASSPSSPASTPAPAATTASAQAAAAPGTIVGGVGSCTTTKGALVAVDFAHWNGPVVRGCGTPTPTTGLALLTKAGFTTAGTQHDGPAFVCRIGSPLFAGGAQYPTKAQDACVATPPASAYWSYWVAKKGAKTWTYSTLGAASYKPGDGEVEAWTFGATNVGGTTGQPSFTPKAVRAGLRSGAVTGQQTSDTDHRATTSHPTKATAGTTTTRGAQRAQVRRTAAATAPDLAGGVAYLTSSANLVGGTHYEPFGAGFTDFGLTIDGAFALAATGSDDAALKAITDYVAAHGDSWTGIGTQYADGGALAKEAVLAEVTGHDPRHFGGHDLIAALTGVACTGASSACAAAGNFAYASSTFSQSLAVIALLRAGDTTDAAAPLAYLRSLQHGSGAFPSILGQTDSDVDSTGMAAMALALDANSAGAVSDAAAWLAGQQQSDGGFPGAAGNSTNSAALAVQGLALAGTTYASAIERAKAFLAARQNSDGGFDVAVGADGSDLRASAQAVGGTVGTSFGTLSDNVSGAVPDVAAGARYLVGQLVDGTHLEYGGGFGPNYGGTADIALALAASGGQDDVLVKIEKYLVAHVQDYVDPDGKAAYPGPFTGAAGKLAVLAEITKQDPADFGGVDLLRVLTDNVCPGPDTAGACSAAGDFANAYSVTSQALGVLALARAGRTVPAPALQRLLDVQCSDGGFKSVFSDPGCTSEVDTTGFAVQALALVPSASTALDRALTYVRDAQTSDGGWPGAAGINSNSAALAVMALLAAPSSSAARTALRAAAATPSASDAAAVKKGLTFLAGLQNSDGGFGISAQSPDSDERATAQAVPAAARTSLTTLLHPVSLTAAAGGSGPTTGSSGSTGSSGGSTTGGTTGTTTTGTTTGSDSLADTGAPTGQLLAWALALLLAGAVALLAGRRRTAVGADGRHRAGA